MLLPIERPASPRPTICALSDRHAVVESHSALTTDVLARFVVMAPRLVRQSRGFLLPILRRVIRQLKL